MRVTAGLRKQLAAVAVVIAIAASTAGCIPDSQPGPPPDPLAAQVLTIVNQARAGMWYRPPQLQHSPRLELTANVWANLMGKGFGLVHQNLGDMLFNKPEFAAYWTLGETLLVGPANMTAQQIVAAWWGSAAHRADLLNPNFNVAGFGHYTDGAGRMWICMDFGGLR